LGEVPRRRAKEEQVDQDLLLEVQRENPIAGMEMVRMARRFGGNDNGVHLLYKCSSRISCFVPAINVNDSVTNRSRHLYGCRHSLVDGLNRALDVMIAGKVASSCVTVTSAKAARNHCAARAARRVITEIDRSTRFRRRWKATK